MKENKLAKKISVRQIVLLQAIVLVYTFADIFAKKASDFEFPSFQFILFFGLEFVVLGIYSLLWQQMIKRVDLSIAYANRSTAIIWSLVWAMVFFGKDGISLQNIIGVAFIVAGTMIVNTDNG